MLIVDGHLDLSMNALQWNRDLLRAVYTIRTMEQYVSGKGRAQGTVAYPEMRRGRIALCFATLIARSTGRHEPHIDFPSPAQAYGAAMGQMAYYHALAEQGHVRVLTDLAGLDAHLAEWEAWDAAHPHEYVNTPPLGFVISLEGADPILAPEQLHEWWAVGLRLIGPTHYGPGRYAGGTGTELGLTDLGRRLLPEMERLGFILDLTHCSDQAYWQALELYHGPVIASHSNCRALVPHQRQFNDDQLRAIIARGGVIGAAFDTWMLEPGWVVGQSTNANVPMAKAVDHIDHVCQLAGNSGHAAIGTDLDGGFGREQSPCDLDTIADLRQIAGLLTARGYGEADVRAILHGNWIRLLRQAWSH